MARLIRESLDIVILQVELVIIILFIDQYTISHLYQVLLFNSPAGSSDVTYLAIYR